MLVEEREHKLSRMLEERNHCANFPALHQIDMIIIL